MLFDCKTFDDEIRNFVFHQIMTEEINKESSKNYYISDKNEEEDKNN